MTDELSTNGLRTVIEDPVRFARGLLRADIWELQARILRSVAANPRTAVKACHASGKTFVAALAVLWWITRFRDGIVVTTAPTWTQVEKLLWGEIHKAMHRSRIKYPTANQTELRLAPGNFAIGLSTNEGVRFQGFHGDHVLIVLDEAPGVLPEIWEAIEGIRAGGDVRVLALGNPTISSGPFYDAFSAHRDQWSTFTISAFDSPNLAGLTLDDVLLMTDEELGTAERSFLVTRRWVSEKWAEWGEGHPLWEARVLGQFPTQSDDALISLAWLEDAAERPVEDTGGFVHAGLDVAGPGEDETVLVIREGSSILSSQSWGKADPRGEVAAALAPWRNRLDTINVDSAGIGYYFGKHLDDLGYPVRLLNVGQSSSDSEKYANKKAEFYWGLRLRFQEGDVAGLTDEQAIGQLSSILYRHDARGRIAIESKEDSRKRGVKSPDRAEAIMLAFATPALGWRLISDAPPDDAIEQAKNAYREQLEAGVPHITERPSRTNPYNICGDCIHFQSPAGTGHLGFCRLQNLSTRSDEIQCFMWDLRR